MESELTQTIFNVAAQFNIPAIILGGLALPAYNVFRTTIDVDICVYIISQKGLDEFVVALKREDIETIQNPKIEHDLFTVFRHHSEAEIWLKPCDAFSWDQQMLEKIQNYVDNISVLSLEDFILTKLARADRSSIDIDDILQILINNYNNIDWKYLRFRIKWKDLMREFKDILQAFEIDMNNEYRTIGKTIIDRFNER